MKKWLLESIKDDAKNIPKTLKDAASSIVATPVRIARNIWLKNLPKMPLNDSEKSVSDLMNKMWVKTSSTKNMWKLVSTRKAALKK